MTEPLPLTMACGLYDRMIDIYRRAVEPDGIELKFVDLDGSAGAREIFDRMAGTHEFDLAEFSGSEFIARKQAGDDSFVAIPVFPSRVFRHGMITVNKGRGITTPKDLAGRRVGVPIYSMSAATWICGQLRSDFQVDLSTVTWVEGAVDSSGPHGSPSILPLVKDVDIEKNTTGKSLSRLLEDGGDNGGIDALVGTVLPGSYFSNPDIVRLFPNYREIERDYFRRTRIFPIMHLIAIRRDVYERHPFIADSLFDAFCESKDRARARMRDLGTLQYMLPWMTDDIDEIDDVFDGDAWPYGIEPNRPTLEAFVAYLLAQGIIRSPIAIEELFVPVNGRYSGETGMKNS